MCARPFYIDTWSPQLKGEILRAYLFYCYYNPGSETVKLSHHRPSQQRTGSEPEKKVNTQLLATDKNIFCYSLACSLERGLACLDWNSVIPWDCICSFWVLAASTPLERIYLGYIWKQFKTPLCNKQAKTNKKPLPQRSKKENLLGLFSKVPGVLLISQTDNPGLQLESDALATPSPPTVLNRPSQTK